MRMKSVIFDMDGGLLDSEPHYLRDLVILMEQHGVRAQIDDLGLFVGESNANIARLIHEKFEVVASPEAV